MLMLSGRGWYGGAADGVTVPRQEPSVRMGAAAARRPGDIHGDTPPAKAESAEGGGDGDHGVQPGAQRGCRILARLTLTLTPSQAPRVGRRRDPQPRRCPPQKAREEMAVLKARQRHSGPNHPPAGAHRVGAEILAPPLPAVRTGPTDPQHGAGRPGAVCAPRTRTRTRTRTHPQTHRSTAGPELLKNKVQTLFCFFTKARASFFFFHFLNKI